MGQFHFGAVGQFYIGDNTHPKRISQIADDVVSHFAEHVRHNGFKGMLVCKDKQAVELYATALREGVLTIVAIGSRWVCACWHCTEFVP